MPYTLTVTSLPARPEFVFDDAAVARLGRTADNDIVVRDPNASRAHCRVFARDGKHWVEDLGSANGTTVNGDPIRGAVPLRDGDVIGIGEVSFGFAVQAAPGGETGAAFTERDTVVPGSLKARTDLREKLVKTGLRAAVKRPPITSDPPGRAQTLDEPPSVDSEVPVAIARARTLDEPATSVGPAPASVAALRALDEPPTGVEPVPPSVAALRTMDEPPTADLPAPAQGKADTVALPFVAEAPAGGPTVPLPEVAQTAELDTVPPPVAPEVDTEPPRPPVNPTLEVDTVPPLVRRGRDRGPAEDSQLKEPTAADRARLRRRANETMLGALVYAWAQLALPARLALGGALTAALVALAALGWRMLQPPPARVLPPEPTELVNQGQLIEHSFGLGGVDYERADLKAFTFKAVAPTRLVGILHFEARDIGKNEVALSLNGADLGFVPPDGVGNETRQLEVLLPPSSVKKNQQNQLVFDNVNNPPGKDTWAVWNLWLQLSALPEAGSEQAVVEAREQLDRAQKLYERRDIAPDALFKAWRSYRDAWLMLEGMPGRPSDLYTIARTQQSEVWRQLDARCRTMQINYQRALKAEVPDRKRARVVMKDMLRYFPSAEHPCHLLVQGELDRLDP